MARKGNKEKKKKYELNKFLVEQYRLGKKKKKLPHLKSIFSVKILYFMFHIHGYNFIVTKNIK